MKIQGLAIIAIIIILPMSIILNAYSQNQIKTLDLQIQYDSKLNSATYDAIKAFQLNMSNSSTSELANSKMRDINASVNTFYNSLSSHFNMSGYGRDVLQNYVPAIVYTLYDGYYIYSTYHNKLQDPVYSGSIYQDGKSIDGLKPYIYYSCRYKPRDDSDFVITYSLDSYITIQGTVKGKPINESGYLLTGVEKRAGNSYYYRGIEIVEENVNDKPGLKQNVYVKGDKSGRGEPIKLHSGEQLGSILQYPCKKINGVKYYQEDADTVFSIINDTRYNQTEVKGIEKNNNGIRYYKEAYDFKENVIKNNSNYSDILQNLKVSDAVDSNGNKYTTYGTNNPYEGRDYAIFGELFNSSGGTYIEDENSSFNAHKLQVIKNAIESNLIPAISNYNKVSTSQVNFAMPKLKEYEWEQITQNVSMITFLQGLNIGGKIYNGYSIVSNNNNEDYVSPDSIYILDDVGEYHRVTEEGLENKIGSKAVGILNTDFERRTTTVSEKINGVEYSKPIYFYPREDSASYHSIININENNNSVYEYFKNVNSANPADPKYKLAQIYYTALGRERFGMYRIMNKLEEVQEVMTKGEDL